MQQARKKSMVWVFFALGAALCWGVYGPMLHRGQVSLGNPMKALRTQQGGLSGFNSNGTTGATLAGVLGALGAVCIIYAFKSGGIPTYVMPLVFGGAPVVNALVSMAIHPPDKAPNPLLYVGMLLASIGAGMVLYFKPPA
jgi:hypothetical protein